MAGISGKNEQIGSIMALSAGIVWGFLGPVIREMSDTGYTTAQMTCTRYIVVSLILFAYLALRNMEGFRVDPRILLVLIFTGVVGNALNSTCYFSSMERISISLATILQYLSPFIVLMMSVPLFGERLTRTKIAAGGIAFIGCVLCTGILTDMDDIDTVGILLGIASAVFFACYTLGSKKAGLNGCSAATILFYSAVACAVFLLPICDMGSATETASGSWYAFGLILVLGVLLTLIPFGLYNLSLKRISAGKVVILAYIEPMTATVVGLLMYGEEVGIGTVAGIAMILLALILVNRNAAGTSKSDN